MHEKRSTCTQENKTEFLKAVNLKNIRKAVKEKTQNLVKKN